MKYGKGRIIESPTLTFYKTNKEFEANMKTNSFIRHIFVVLMSWLALSGWFVANPALAATEFQLIKSMGKLEGTPYAKLIQDSEGNLYGTTFYGGSTGAGTVFKLTPGGEFSFLHEFDGGSEGAKPYAGLIHASDGNFYGSTSAGGSKGAGIIFKLNQSGNFEVLHEFDGASGGATPLTGLIQANDGSFYGTTSAGGSDGYGTVFKLDASGNFTVLHHFNDSDGNYPFGELLQADNGNFYGTTNSGGSNNSGVIFTLDVSGSFSVLHHFNADDGTNPIGSLIQGNDGSFYGTTSSGGSHIGGTVFKFDASGNFSVITDFSAEHTGSTYAGVIQDNDGNFYGTWANGGSNGYGTVFKLDSSGNLSLLHEFSGGSGGGGPMAALIQGSDGSFYGTTVGGGNNEAGTVFKVDSSGNFSTLYAFEGFIDAFYPSSLIQANDGNFYGTTSHGGEYDFGTVFMLDSDENINILHSFDGINDGLRPSGLVQADDGSFYGATTGGFLDDSLSGYAVGTLFKLDSSENFSELYTFDYSDDIGSYANNYLIQGIDGNFYGTTPFGGSAGAGTVFKWDATGNISILHEFDGGSGGANPSAGVIQARDGNFYGTTSGGGNDNSEGVAFKLTASGEFSILHTFNGTSDGKNPAIPLIQGLDGNFYGITPFGSANDAGTIFKLEPTGNYNVLHVFDDTSYGNGSSSLIQAHNGKFYGTRPFGGDNDSGVVFELESSGSYTILHSFKGEEDGSYPGGVTQANDGSIYGFAPFGGLFGHGTLFHLVETSDNPEPPDDTLSVAMSSSPNPSLRGQRVTFTATVTGNHPTGTVQFLDGSKKLGTMPLINGIATVSTSRLKSGRHLITAVYSGDGNNASVTSAPFVHGVKAVTKKELRARPRGALGRGGR
jgi:uncharacterized repeat protein (TIGR03803 family)